MNIDPIVAHYGRGDLRGRILTAMQNGGINIDALTRDDLGSFDEFHIGGRPATIALAQKVGLTPGTNLLDVGSGIGGPARTFAAEFGSQVTGIDLTQEFCLTAEMLTERLKMSQSIRFQQGSATEMPFKDGQFDVAWMQHVGMNIADKAKLYSEIRRVVRPNGRFVFHEILEGNGQPLHFPVMWAEEQSLSHLATPKLIRDQMASLGCRETYWEDITTTSLAWLKENMRKMQQEGPPPLNLGVLFGKNVSQNLANILRNLEEGRMIVVQGCFQV